jgi:hypothetical protein
MKKKEGEKRTRMSAKKRYDRKFDEEQKKTSLVIGGPATCMY